MRNLKSGRALSLIAALLLTILWTRLGWFGRMPVGGDATRFGLGLMSELTRAADRFSAPLWNSLWGYGFPSLAESQLGAFYPPHQILYRLLPLEYAYTFDIELHALWAALGCWVLANSLGRCAFASFLVSAVFVTSGFFLVHEPHHWAWPTGSWLPWIWWAGLRMAKPGNDALKFSPGKVMTLATCFAMPVLTGHFQIGFISVVSGLSFWFALIFTNGSDANSGSSLARLVRFGMGFLFACIVAAGLSAIQLLPTKELADTANRQRDWEYLSGFAAAPTHWLGLLVPALGRTVPFWRPLIWDQFHTSPEELMFYVGLMPLWLATVGAIRTWRIDPVTRALLLTLAVSLFLAAGPYSPGFSRLIQLPGFSYFRAPARWTLAATLAIALLCGRGWEEAVLRIDRVGVSLRRYCAVALLVIAAVVGLIEATSRAAESRPRDSSPFLNVVDSVRRLIIPPWGDVGGVRDWVIRSRATTASTIPAYAKPYTDLELSRFTTDRPTAYAREVGPQLGLILLMLVGSIFLKASRARFTAFVCLIMAADCVVLSRLRSIETARLGEVTSQSPVLSRLRDFSSTSDWPAAIWGDLGNLPMAAGASPIRAYRTLDVPVMSELESRLAYPFEPRDLRLARLTGVGMLVIDPPTWARMRDRWRPDAVIEEIDDPNLWSWLTTSELARQGPTTFALVRPNGPVARAWRIPVTKEQATGGEALTDATSPDRIDDLEERASPLIVERPIPESIVIMAETAGPELWILAQWADQNWKATLTSNDGKGGPVMIQTMHGEWQGIAIPTAGRWRLDMRYDPTSFRIGAKVTIATTVAVLAMLIWLWLRSPKAGSTGSQSV